MENTPRTDAWCELAMHADISAVLELAKQYERELNRRPTEMRYQQSLYRNTELNDKLNASNSLLTDAAQAIDALLIFGHQYSMNPLLREMSVLERIQRHLKSNET